MLGNKFDHIDFNSSGSLRELIVPEQLPWFQIELVILIELELFRRTLC